MARNLATSALNSAIAKLRKNTADSGLVTTPLAGYSQEEACGYVSFERNNALGVPYSLNNLQGDFASPGYDGATVPAHTAHIIAVGRFHGLEHRLESILAIPYLPYAVACKGPFVSHGGLTVAGLVGLGQAQVDRGGLDGALGTCGPATALSNAAGVALTLGPQDHVIGNAQAVGTVSKDSSANITGETREGYDPVPLPRVNLADYDVLGRPGLQELTSPLLPAAPLDGFKRREGSLTVAGDLILQDSVLFVTGDLTVQGGVSGVGALVVGGNLKIGRGGRLGTESFTALLVDGNLTISADAAKHAEIRGLVYVGGDFSGSYVDVLGSVVANGAGSRVDATNCRFVHVPIQSIAISKFGNTDIVAAPLLTYTVASDLDLAYGPVEVKMNANYESRSKNSGAPLGYVIPDDVVLDPLKIFDYAEIHVGSHVFTSSESFKQALVKTNRLDRPGTACFNEMYSLGWFGGSLGPLTDFSRATLSGRSISYPADQPRLEVTGRHPWGGIRDPVPSFDERLAMTAKLLAQSQWTNYVVNTHPVLLAQTWKMDLSRLLSPNDRIRTLMVRDR